MSADIAFSELRYPTIPTAGLEEETDRARARGYAAGYAEGLRAAEAEAEEAVVRARVEREAMHAGAATALTAALDALRTASCQFEAAAAPVLEDADEALVAAAIELASAIIDCELDDATSSARTAIARALSTTDPDAITAVRVSPVDLAVFGAYGVTVPELRFVSDPTLSPGDAVVEIADGRIDARISTALERARAELAVAR
ncbi:MAG: hypothetical protein HIU88_00455 [Acidobacteria bacterium]|nr:hypothetical protein [Acidobacteriota bacterium]